LRKRHFSDNAVNRPLNLRCSIISGEIMALTIGSQLGSHEITALLGKGGMGEVYRARDLKLKREVAIKILPEEFSRDPERISRFQREAELLASLNHPNIAAIYDVEEANNSRFLVLELIEGETLADRLRRGPLPVDEALHIARSICEALEAAHEKGVIHRDLKPANVKVTTDGQVKVLDFGLAKAVENAPDSALLANSPTMLSGTMGGMILGTAAYMSPEQANGKIADRRSDIWSFGAVLYEMLSGKRAFAGESVSDTLASVLKLDPDWNAVPQDTPASIRKLTRRCLTKDRKQRLQAIGEARICIDEALVGGMPVEAEGAAKTRLARLWPTLSVGALVMGALVGWAFTHFLQPTPEQRVYRFEINPPEGARFAFGFYSGGVSLSPDGRTIAFVATAKGKTSLWVRPLDGPAAREVAGTEGAGFPFWSPDSKSVGFFAGSKLQRFDLAGGTLQTICSECSGRSGAWSADGRILFGRFGSGLFQVAASGGAPAPFTTLDTALGESAHVWPQMLPGGKFLYYVGGTAEKPDTSSGIFAASLSKPNERVKLLNRAGTALYVAGPGGESYLIWRRNATAVAQKFDPSALKLTGDPIPLVTPVSSLFGQISVDISASGPLVYYSPSTSSQLTWFDRGGKPVGFVGEPIIPTTGRGFRISPNGHLIAANVSTDEVNSNLNSNLSLWLIDVERGVPTKFTAGIGGYPVWSPDSRTIIYTAGAPGYAFRKQVGVGGEQRFKQAPYQFVTDWSRDGRFVMGFEGPAGSHQSLWIRLASPDDAAPKPYTQATFSTSWGRFSPDTHWIAFVSDESGQSEVYVDAFPEPRGKVRISTHGGRFPAWNPNGGELFYVSPDYKLVSVALKVTADLVQVSTPKELFQVPALDPGSNPYDVAPDGQRFLVPAAAERIAAQPLKVIVNWTSFLKTGVAQ
jgi:Tol biopolymer transport system component